MDNESVKAWEPKPQKWPWRDFLTADEIEVVQSYDTIKAEHDALMAQWKGLTRDVSLIRNRAIQRAKYAAVTITPRESE